VCGVARVCVEEQKRTGGGGKGKFIYRGLWGKDWIYCLAFTFMMHAKSASDGVPDFRMIRES
jgi:hypothetical protein